MKSVMFDIDGVLADWVQGFTTLCHEIDPRVQIYTHPKAKAWDLPEIPEHVQKEAWACVRESDKFWCYLESLVDDITKTRIRRLSVTANVYFVTNRMGVNAKIQTEAWLKGEGFARHPTVILTGRKGEFARTVGADFCIDDKAGNAIYAAYHSPGTKSFLLDRAYNQFDAGTVGSKVCRVKTVDEYLDEVEK